MQASCAALGCPADEAAGRQALGERNGSVCQAVLLAVFRPTPERGSTAVTLVRSKWRPASKKTATSNRPYLRLKLVTCPAPPAPRKIVCGRHIDAAKLATILTGGVP
jgi:hypothetical protein